MIHNKNTVDVNAGVGTKQETGGQNPEQTQAHTETTNRTSGFMYGRRNGSFNTTAGSEYVGKIQEMIVDLYNKKLPETQRPIVHVLDKSQLQYLAYSAIIVSKLAGDNVYYYTVPLAKTGLPAKKASEMMAEYMSAIKANQEPFIYTLDDTINVALHKIIRTSLTATYGNKTFVSLEGTVIPDTAEEGHIANIIASLAFTALDTEIKLTTGNTDLNLAESAASSPNTVLRFESNVLRQVNTSVVGKAKRTDWQIRLMSLNTSTQKQYLNVDEGNLEIAATSGFVDAVPREEEVVMGYNNVKKVTSLIPLIVINDVQTESSTLGYSLLSLLSAALVTEKDLYLRALVPGGPKDHNNTGALNVIANIENEENGGSVYKLGDKSVTLDKAAVVLDKMFTGRPAISMDIESFGDNSYQLSPFTVAATGGKGALAAAKLIIKSANRLTNGSFPMDFNPNDIFQFGAVTIPTGEWADNTGIRDIKDVDLSFVCNKTGDIGIIKDWIATYAPKNVSGLDPFITRVKIISDLVPSAEISGKATRVTFKNKFIQTLVNASIAAGFTGNFNVEQIFTNQTNISVIGNIFDGSGVSNATGFANHGINNLNSYQSNGSGMGRGRWA